MSARTSSIRLGGGVGDWLVRVPGFGLVRSFGASLGAWALYLFSDRDFDDEEAVEDNRGLDSSSTLLIMEIFRCPVLAWRHSLAPPAAGFLPEFFDIRTCY